MKKISFLVTSIFIAAMFSVSAFGQVATPANGGKIGWINTAEFSDEKAGVTKYNNALKALEAEMKPRVTELQGMQTKLQALSEEIRKLSTTPGNVPIPPATIQAKQEEGQRIQREMEFKKKEYDAAMAKRGNELLGPIQNDLLKAIGDYAKQKGYAVVLDIAALANDNMNAILALDPAANITKDFITFYNARPATTATTATPR